MTAGGRVSPASRQSSAPPRWRLRISYSKTGRLRYISHLDFVRLFERVARRAGLPVAMSEGFNPAPRVAYGWPLPVGMAGLGEYLDVELVRRMDPRDVVDRLNRVMPEGIVVGDARYVSPHGPSLMAELNTASYLVRMAAGERDREAWREAASRVLASPRLEIVRDRGVRGDRPPKEKVIDIRPFIGKVDVRDVADGDVVVYMELAMTERGTARPEEVVRLIRGGLGLEDGPEGVTTVRLGLRREAQVGGAPAT